MCLSDLLDISEGGMGHAFGGRTGRPATHLAPAGSNECDEALREAGVLDDDIAT